MQHTVAPDPRTAWQLTKLRDAILARLLLGPASLHRLALDLEHLYNRDAVEAPPLLLDIAEEIRLYKNLGLVEEGPSGNLYLNQDRVPADKLEELEALAARMAEHLEAWPAPPTEHPATGLAEA